MGPSSLDNFMKLVFDAKNTPESCDFKIYFTLEAIAIYMQPLLMCYANPNKILFPTPSECPIQNHARFCAVLWHGIEATHCSK